VRYLYFQTVPKKIKVTQKQDDTGGEARPISSPPTKSGRSRPASSQAKKSTVKKITKPRAPKILRSKTAAGSGPTDEQIRIRAYFISERRHRLALPGDATSDWEEARRQLLSEASSR
jgi:hypothetical protein